MFKRLVPYRSVLLRVGGILLIALYVILFSIPRKDKVTESNQEIDIPLSILNIDANIIAFKPKAQLSDRFYFFVNRAVKGQEPLRLLHIGDSHIQADFFSGETRRLLSNWLLDDETSRGFTFPYQIAGTNNPDDYNVSWKGEWKRIRPIDSQTNELLGVAAIAVSTYDKNSEFTLTLNRQQVNPCSFDYVKIYFSSTNSSVAPFIKNDGELIEVSKGFVAFKLKNPNDSLTIGLTWNGNTQVDTFTLFGMELLNSQSRLFYHAAGVNGANVGTFLRSQNFCEHLSQLNPHVVIVSLGTNDAYSDVFNSQIFAKNLRQLVTNIQATLPQSIVILTTPGDHLINRERKNEALNEVQDQIYNLAAEMNCGVWDFYQVMGGAGSINSWAQMGMCSNDMLHFNRKGYQMQGALLFDALVKLSGFEHDDIAKHIANE
jgi:lysophospholipase L1-like esterase